MNWGSAPADGRLRDRTAGGSTTPTRLWSLLAALVGLAALFAFHASASQAAIEATRTYVPGAFFGGQGSDPGQFDKPGQIAIEPGTGNLLVADRANGRVQVFSTDAEGNPSYLTNLGEGTVVEPVGIAIDQTTGAIYVSDAGANQVFRFTSDGAATPTYTLDPTFTSPTLSSYASTLAVDPTTHDLLVADTGSQEIRRFDVGDGHQISAFNGADSPAGQFTSLRGVAVAASGTIYVADDSFPGAIFYAFTAGRVESFDADGSSLGQLQGLSFPGMVGIGPDGGVIVGQHNNVNYNVPPKQLAFFDGTASPASVINFPGSVEGGTAGVVFSQTSPFALYVLVEQGLEQFGVSGIEPFVPADIPVAELGPTSAIGPTGAHVSGSVAPGTASGTGTARFEYSLDGSNWTSTPDQGGISGPGETAVSADLADLRPNSGYTVRLRVSNDDFSRTSPTATFSTAPVAPGVALTPVTDRTSDSVVVRGRVNPFGAQATYHFEYGTTTAYGNVAPVGAEGVAGAGYDPRFVAASLSGLAPSTTYHYRLVATNETGTNSSADATFTTRPAMEPARAYEQVTPIDKGGALIKHVSGFQARADGNGLIYGTANAMNLPGVEGAPQVTRYLGHRTSAGWGLFPVDPPQNAVATAELMGAVTIAVSPDQSHALVVSNKKLAPGGVEGTGNFYRRDLASGAYETIASGADFGQLIQSVGLRRYYGGTADFSTIFLASPEALTPDETYGLEALYEWREGQGLRLASPALSYMPLPEVNEWPARTMVADDGSAYFSIQYSAEEGIYRARDGVTERVLDPGFPTMVAGVTPNGRYLTYIGAFDGNLYRYDIGTGESQLIFTNTTANGGRGYMGMSDDGSTIFDTGSSGKAPTVWHNGETTAIGVASGEDGVSNRGSMISPNGRYVVFASITLEGQPYDNSGCPYDPLNSLEGSDRCFEVYVYDTEAKKLDCASCPSDGARSTGAALLGPTTLDVSHYAPRHVSNSGQVLFDTPTSLVAADTNGTRDVYLYQDGEVQLISPGTGKYNAFSADASANFDDIFFVTTQPLVAQDRDNLYDIYDARVGGGLPSQQVGGSKDIAPCSGSDCRAPVAPATSPPATASEAVSGRAAPAKPGAHRKHHAKKTKKKRRGKHRRAGHHRHKAGAHAGRSSRAASNNRHLGR